MTERREEIAELYSRAHLEGSRYWDFSASRNQVRGQFRRRMGQETERSLASEPPAVSRDQNSKAASAIENAQPENGLSSRWFALQSVLKPSQFPEAESTETGLEPKPPFLLVLSFAGGVGKTCLVATLGRALAALGERVLLAETAMCSMLPFYFGSREFRPGVVRTFSPPGSSAASQVSKETDTPVRVLTLQAEVFGGETGHTDPMIEELLRDSASSNRILVDVATASQDVTSRLLLLRPLVLVPVLPDMSSIASLRLLELLLADVDGPPLTVFYLLNQFEPSLPLHVDVRALLQRELGNRLLPFVVRRSSAVSEALAEGMTVIDYAPDSEAAEDYRSLANWLRGFAAPGLQGHRSARWSED
jgi:cellulose synthase operon protein YhjQ